MLVPATASAGVLGLCWIAIKNEAGLIVFAILYASFSGLILSPLPSCFPVLATNMKALVTNIGMTFAIVSLDALSALRYQRLFSGTPAVFMGFNPLEALSFLSPPSPSLWRGCGSPALVW